jgi:flagellar motility protein MotE (MotC chaperone)
MTRALAHAWTMAGALALASMLAGLPPVAAQQTWAPLITPSDAATNPLPRARAEAPAVPRRGPVAAPLPFSEQRKSAGDNSAPSFTSSLAPRAEQPPFETPLARAYCAAIGSAAGDAKFAWQRKALTELAQDLEGRIAKLEAATAEYRKWLARRDEFAKRAHDTLTVIYSRMRPDAAALQLTAMDEETAAAVLIKLDPRVASAILNDMNPQHAARLTATISGAGRTTPPPNAKATPAAAPAPAPTPTPAQTPGPESKS